jgi:WD40 repeat protein
MSSIRTIILMVVILCGFEALAEAPAPELVMQVGHASGVRAIHFAPNGRWLATTGKDAMVRIWDAVTLQELRGLSGSTHEILALAISPDGEKVAAASQDQTIRIWDVTTGRVLLAIGRELKGEQDWKITANGVRTLAFSPDSRNLLAGLESGQLLVLDWINKKVVKRLQAHVKAIQALKVTRDGRRVFTGSLDRMINVWDPISWQKTSSLQLDDDVANLAVNADGSRLAVVTADSFFTLSGAEISLWNTASWTKLHELKGGRDLFCNVEFTPDGKRLAGVAYHIGMFVKKREGTFHLWDAATAKLIYMKAIHNDMGTEGPLAFCPDGGSVAVRGDRGQLLLLDASTGASLVKATSSPPLIDIGVSEDGKRVLTQALEQGLLGGVWVNGKRARFDDPAVREIFGETWQHGVTGRLWDGPSGGVIRALGSPDSITWTFSPDGRRIASHRDDHSITVTDLVSGEEKSLAKLGKPAVPNEMTLSVSGNWLAVRDGGDIEVVDLKSSQAAFSLKGGHLLQFTQDERYLVALSKENWLKDSADYVSIYALPAGKKIRDIPLARGVRSMALDREGRQLAVVEDASDITKLFDAEQRIVKIWDIESGRPGHQWRLPPGEWAGVAFSSDGQRLAASGGDFTVHVFDTIGGRETLALKGHSQQVTAVRFHEQDKLLLTASHDGTLRVWDTLSGTHMATLCTFRDSPDWLVVTPDGLFDGSPMAWKKMTWRFGDNTFNTVPLELYFNEFYYPGLLTDILKNRRPKAPFNLATLDRRQPQVTLSVAKPLQGKEIAERLVEINLNVQGSPPDTAHLTTSGAKDLRLFRNGILVKRWQGTVVPKGQDKAVTLNTKVTLVSGENRLVAYAFNDDNIKSSDATLAIKGAPSLSRRGSLYLLAVGLNEYANSRYNLAFAAPDADVFTKELKRTQTTLNKYANVEVIALYNGDATKANILAALHGFAGQTTEPGAKAPAALSRIKQAQPEDALIIYYAGHGTANRDRFYLLPHDLGYPGDPANLTEMSLAQILAHGISDREIEEAVEKIDAGRMVLVIDACNSGQALDAEEKRRGPMNAKGLAQLAYEKGMYVLTAAQSYQVAMESAPLGHGFLTFALAEEALKSDVADTSPRDGQVLLREWLDYAVARVPEIHQEMIGTRKGTGRGVSVVAKPQLLEVVKQWDVQRPRVFYRREPETNPMVIVAPKNQ